MLSKIKNLKFPPLTAKKLIITALLIILTLILVAALIAAIVFSLGAATPVALGIFGTPIAFIISALGISVGPLGLAGITGLFYGAAIAITGTAITAALVAIRNIQNRVLQHKKEESLPIIPPEDTDENSLNNNTLPIKNRPETTIAQTPKLYARIVDFKKITPALAERMQYIGLTLPNAPQPQNNFALVTDSLRDAFHESISNNHPLNFGELMIMPPYSKMESDVFIEFAQQYCIQKNTDITSISAELLTFNFQRLTPHSLYLIKTLQEKVQSNKIKSPPSVILEAIGQLLIARELVNNKSVQLPAVELSIEEEYSKDNLNRMGVATMLIGTLPEITRTDKEADEAAKSFYYTELGKNYLISRASFPIEYTIGELFSSNNNLAISEEYRHLSITQALTNNNALKHIGERLFDRELKEILQLKYLRYVQGLGEYRSFSAMLVLGWENPIFKHDTSPTQGTYYNITLSKNYTETVFVFRQTNTLSIKYDNKIDDLFTKHLALSFYSETKFYFDPITHICRMKETDPIKITSPDIEAVDFATDIPTWNTLDPNTLAFNADKEVFVTTSYLAAVFKMLQRKIDHAKSSTDTAQYSELLISKLLLVKVYNNKNLGPLFKLSREEKEDIPKVFSFIANAKNTDTPQTHAQLLELAIYINKTYGSKINILLLARLQIPTSTATATTTMPYKQ